MNYRKQFLVSPGQRIQLKDIDPSFADDEENKKSAHRVPDFVPKAVWSERFEPHTRMRSTTAAQIMRRGLFFRLIANSWTSPDGKYFYQIYPNASKLISYRINGNGKLDKVGEQAIPYNSPQGMMGY
ncbi:MAG: hypothetical protein ABJB66_05260 [Gemmatimonadaceae bacterium]